MLALDDVKLYTRTPDLQVLVATDSQIRDQIARAWAISHDGGDVSAMVETVDEDDDDGRLTTSRSAPTTPRSSSSSTRSWPTPSDLRASDIHIEVQRDALRVRYRVDGLLRDVMNAPKRIATSVVSRIKIISGLDIAERRIPQDGRTRFMVDDHAVDARVSTLPVAARREGRHPAADPRRRRPAAGRPRLRAPTSSRCSAPRWPCRRG